MINVLVTGKDSQLARCIKDLEHKYSEVSLTYKTSSELNITDKNSIANNFTESNYDFCINCAAYTAVDKAEIEQQEAKDVNTFGALYLADACAKHKTTLIHISTDFVFDGQKATPYFETDNTNPLNTYGLTKRDGENEIINALKQHYIIRTSWLYSEYGNNFLKTMLGLLNHKNLVKVVDDQIGCPTYAKDLAFVILKIISSKIKKYGIYHYSNVGSVSWYNFAQEIFRLSNAVQDVAPVKAKDYNTTAKRPKYTVLSSKKIEETFKTPSKKWDVSLLEALKKLQQL